MVIRIEEKENNNINLYMRPEDKQILKRYCNDIGQSMSKMITHFIHLHITNRTEVKRYYTIKLSSIQEDLRKINLELEFNIKELPPKHIIRKSSEVEDDT